MAEVERRTSLSKNTIANAIYGPRKPQRKTIEILAVALDLPVETLTRADALTPESHPYLRFGQWLFRWGNPGLWIAGLGILLTIALLTQSLEKGLVSPAVQAVHFLVILVLLVRLPRISGPSEKWKHAEGSSALVLAAAGDFRRYWGLVWMAWLFLYLGLTVGSFFGVVPSAEGDLGSSTRWLVVVLNLVQNGATVMLFLSYEVVARPTIKADLSRKQVLPIEAWIAFALLFSFFEGGIVGLDYPWEIQQWFGWISGFAQGTALALLVGRLDSKYIDPPAILVALLYFYACIQGAWPALQSHSQLLLVLTVLALTLKCLLFLFIAWLFESRILLYFLERLRKLDEGGDRERREFLERI